MAIGNLTFGQMEEVLKVSTPDTCLILAIIRRATKDAGGGQMHLEETNQRREISIKDEAIEWLQSDDKSFMSLHWYLDQIDMLFLQKALREIGDAYADIRDRFSTNSSTET